MSTSYRMDLNGQPVFPVAGANHKRQITRRRSNQTTHANTPTHPHHTTQEMYSIMRYPLATPPQCGNHDAFSCLAAHHGQNWTNPNCSKPKSIRIQQPMWRRPHGSTSNQPLVKPWLCLWGCWGHLESHRHLNRGSFRCRGCLWTSFSQWDIFCRGFQRFALMLEFRTRLSQLQF